MSQQIVEIRTPVGSSSVQTAQNADTGSKLGVGIIAMLVLPELCIDCIEQNFDEVVVIAYQLEPVPAELCR